MSTVRKVSTKPLLTYSQAWDAVQTLMYFSENSKIVDSITFNALSAIERNLRDIKVKLMKQVSVLNYVSSTYLYFEITYMHFVIFGVILINIL